MEIRAWGLVAVVACTPTVPSTPSRATGSQPVAAEFPVPTLSEATRQAWQQWGTEICAGMRPAKADGDCIPHGHAVACPTRDFEAEFDACRGSEACLQVAQDSRECRTCDAGAPASVVESTLQAVASDCAGLVRFVDAHPKLASETLRLSEDGEVDRGLLGPFKGRATIDCLARSRAPRARFVLAMWRDDPAAERALVDHPAETRRWIEHELDRIDAGATSPFDNWQVWSVVELLGDDARPLLPRIRLAAEAQPAGHWDRDHVRDAIVALGNLEDAGAGALLRRRLGDARDWRTQMTAAHALGLIGPHARDAEADLRATATSHWSESVRTMAAWAADTTAGHAADTKPPRAAEPTSDPQCPLALLHVHADRPKGDLRLSHQPWPWAVRIEGTEVTLESAATPTAKPTAKPPAATLPSDFPDVRFAETHPRIEGASVPLEESLAAIRPRGGGWLVGTNVGEFGGSLWWVPKTGAPRLLADDNVIAFIELGASLYALVGLAHLGSSRGALLRVEETPDGPRASHAVELPGRPLRRWVVDDTMYFADRSGVVVVDADLDLSIAPCVAPYSIDGRLELGDILTEVERQRPVIERCLAALPPPELPCGEPYDTSAGLWLRVDAGGRVVQARPMNETPAFAEVERCLSKHASRWTFPPPTGGTAMFGYRFVPQDRPSNDD